MKSNIARIKHSKMAVLARNWSTQIADPIRMVKGVRGYTQFFVDWYKYSQMSHSEAIKIVDTYPQVHDRTSVTAIDSHYFYLSNWAMRRIIALEPALHVDIGSQVIFASLLGAMRPVVFLDYRPLLSHLSGLQCMGGDILALPFADYSVASLSCLHVIEHIGLGRYGDALDPEGTRKAASELARVLAPGGDLFLALPLGQPRVCFNAHRIHTAEIVRQMMPELELVEFSGIHDDGRYVERVSISTFDTSEYACGLFWFRRSNR